jgi:hypothetical protein
MSISPARNIQGEVHLVRHHHCGRGVSFAGEACLAPGVHVDLARAEYPGARYTSPVIIIIAGAGISFTGEG